MTAATPHAVSRGKNAVVSLSRLKGGLEDASELCYGGYEEPDLPCLSRDSGQESALALDIGRAGQIDESEDSLRSAAFSYGSAAAP